MSPLPIGKEGQLIYLPETLSVKFGYAKPFLPDIFGALVYGGISEQHKAGKAGSPGYKETIDLDANSITREIGLTIPMGGGEVPVGVIKLEVDKQAFGYAVEASYDWSGAPVYYSKKLVEQLQAPVIPPSYQEYVARKYRKNQNPTEENLERNMLHEVNNNRGIKMQVQWDLNDPTIILITTQATQGTIQRIDWYKNYINFPDFKKNWSRA